MDRTEQDGIEDRLRRQIEAYHDAALIFAAVTAGIPDALRDAPRAPDDLAAALGLSAPHLRRFLRGLITLRLCEELPDGCFALTPAGRSLTAESASSLREKALVVLGQYWLPWLSLGHCLETGEPSFPHVFGTPLAEWRRANAADAASFHRYLAKEEIVQADDILDDLDMGAARTVASIGGGYGGLLVPLLWNHPRLEAVVFDEPPTVDAAMALFEAYRVADRVRAVAGDPRGEIPVKADVYLLKSVLQQHGDTVARRILANVRHAMPAGARLVIVERLIPENGPPDAATVMSDLHLMVISGGRLRTRPEIEALLSQAGLAASRIKPTPSGLSLVEAVPA